MSLIAIRLLSSHVGEAKGMIALEETLRKSCAYMVGVSPTSRGRWADQMMFRALSVSGPLSEYGEAGELAMGCLQVSGCVDLPLGDSGLGREGVRR